MRVTDFSIADQRHKIPLTEKPSTAITRLATIAGMCNAGHFDNSTSALTLDMRKINGDATDQASLRFSASICPTEELNQDWGKVHEIGFNSKNKFMLTVVESLKETEKRQ